MISVNCRSVGLILILVLCLGSSPQVSAQTEPLAPVYWRQNLFYVPYQANRSDKIFERISKVQLLLSHDGASDWQVLQEALPNVQGFSYHAPEDGEYWLTLRHIDRRGRPTSTNTPHPQLRIIVDTKLPVLRLDASQNLTGELVIRYDASDVHLKPSTLKIEVNQGDGKWLPTRIGQPEVSQPDKLIGRTQWKMDVTASKIAIRASIADHAGNLTKVQEEVRPLGASMPQTQGTLKADDEETYSISALDGKVQNPFPFQQHPAPQKWPSNNQLPPVGSEGRSESATNQLPPPILNPYTMTNTGNKDRRTAGNLIADTGRTNTPATESLSITPLDGNNAPQLLDSEFNTTTPSSPMMDSGAGWKSIPGAQLETIRPINSRTFDVDYEIASAGPWGVSKVELWGTHDGGKTWQSHGVDPDNRSPFRVTVPGSGIYGFLIHVQGANGASAAPPQRGDEPELIVAVDLLPPTVEIQKTTLGSDDFANHLSVQWTALDTNLDDRPIALYYSSSPTGPWTTIAAGLENTGAYRWRIERHVPTRFFLRIEAIDKAGNITTKETSEPILLPRPQPKGHLRSVRPVSRS